MSVFLRENVSPFYYAEFTIQGRRVLRSTKRTTEREARAEERRLKVEVRAEIEKEKATRLGEPMSLDQAFGKYLEEHVPKLAPTWQGEVVRYGKHILTIIDKDTLVENVTDAEVDEFVQEHVATGGGEYALNRALAVWRRVHRLARKRWKQRTHEIDWSEFFNAESQRKNYISISEAERLIDVATERLRSAIEWSLLTGCRRSETFGLLWEKVNLEQGKSTVMAKGGREHTVWLTPDAVALLARIPHGSRYVFDQTNWRRDWEAAVKRAGLTNFRWHDLRHTHATWLRQAGAPLEVVQRSLGHADLQTTQRYAHVADHELQEALRKLPSLGMATAGGNVVSIRSASA